MIPQSSSSSGASPTWWTSLSFGWYTPVLANIRSKLDIGLHPDLEQDQDIPPLPQEDSTAEVKHKFEAFWTAQLTNSDPNLTRALWKAYHPPLVVACVLSVIGNCAQLVGPLVLNMFIPYLLDPSATLGYGLSLVAILSVAQLVQILCGRHASYHCSRVGLRARTALMLAIFQKALRIDSAYYQDHPIGQVVNLMSVDVSKISIFIEYILIIVTMPFLIIGSMVLLWKQLGPSCLGGIFVLLVSIPLSAWVANWMTTFQKDLMKLKDDRINCNQETISNMKIVKMQAWEEPFRERTEAFRHAEVQQLIKCRLAYIVFYIQSAAIPMLVSLLTFGIYVTVEGKNLDAATALAAVALFSIIKIPLLILPLMLNFAVTCSVSLQRIQDFLTAPDYEPLPRLTNTGGEEGDSNNNMRVIDLKDASFSYQRIHNNAQGNTKNDSSEQELLLAKAKLVDAEKQTAKVEGRPPPPLAQYGSTYNDSSHMSQDGDSDDSVSLRHVNFECNEGEFVAVVGGVGSGKSTLLKALLGEVQKVSGEARVRGEIAYFDQNPFIMNDTLRGNILFGKSEEKVDEDLYRLAVKAACLEHDFQLFPAGDQTEIGEKGTNLSGGQKARVAIGRAVYRDADISLLDDCLSAVDAHVGRELFDKCIVDVLLQRNRHGGKRKRTVILVTNALQYLNHALLDRIVVLKDGVVVESGSYSDLVSRENSHFRFSLDAFNESNVNDTESETTEEDDDDDDEYFDEEAFNEMFVDQTVLEATSDPSELVELTRRSSVIMQTSSFVSTRSLLRESSTKNVNLSSTRSLRRKSSIKNVNRSSTRSLRRKSSIKNVNPMNQTTLITDETKEGQIGKVDTELYMQWVKAAGGFWIVIPLFLVFAVPQAVDVGATRWITIWGTSEETDKSSQLYYLEILALIYLVNLFFNAVGPIVPVLFGLKAAKKFFSALLEKMLVAPMSFYDTTPTGRIVNRFSKDISTLDETLIGNFTQLMQNVLEVSATIVILVWTTPIVSVALPFLIILYTHQYDFYNQSNRELKRIDSTSRSPVFNLFGEALDGFCTIRAFEAGPALLYRMCDSIDKQQHATYLLNSGKCWLNVRLGFIGTCLITIGCLAFVIEKQLSPEINKNFASFAGMALLYLLSLNNYLAYLVRYASDLEASMVSVERIQQYTQLEAEAPHQIPADNLLEKNWPSKGSVEFKNVNMRYRPGLPLVLKGLNVVIPSNAKVGICGRTGAGKSTLMVSLTRLVEIDRGQILIDGVDIKTIGLTKLRSSIAIVPQDPVLFSGTVQTNIDPFNHHSKDVLVDALGRVGLYIPNNHSSPIKSVEDNVDQNGSNFSSGQRQLLVIVRALLDNAALVICDEATASIDAESDARIQKVFRTDFAGSTTLTVAHRLNTIMDSTHILVMADGKAVEFDTPNALLSRGGLFKDLVDKWEEEHE